MSIREGETAIWISKPVKEGPPGPYHQIFHYGKQDDLIGGVPQFFRLQDSEWEGGEILGFRNPDIFDHMHRVSEIVNNPLRSENSPEDRCDYQEEIMPVFMELTTALRSQLGSRMVLGDNNYSIYCPLNGGEFTAAALLYCAYKLGWNIQVDRLACFELKRVLTEGEEMYVGARYGYMPPSNPETVNVVFDDCLASDISARTSIAIAETASQSNDSNNSLVVVSAGSQRGMTRLHQKTGAFTISGIPVFSLNDHLYLMRTEAEGYPPNEYVVGNMGGWLGRLPANYNSVAPWNETRMGLVDYWTKTDRYPQLKS